MSPKEFQSLMTAAVAGKANALQGLHRTIEQAKAAAALTELLTSGGNEPQPLPIPDASLLPPCF